MRQKILDLIVTETNERANRHPQAITDIEVANKLNLPLAEVNTLADQLLIQGLIAKRPCVNHTLYQPINLNHVSRY